MFQAPSGWTHLPSRVAKSLRWRLEKLRIATKISIVVTLVVLIIFSAP